jgi:hypothetical protein
MSAKRLSINLLVTICLSIVIASGQGLAENTQAPPVQYQLEAFEFTGSTRLTEDQVKDHLRIKDQIMMTDEWISASRTKLMGLGIFRDVLFSLKKGSRPGLTKLIIRAEDDEDILSDWAVGGEFGLSLTDPTPAFGEDSVFRGYRVGLIARHILRDSHRAAILGDIDSRGNLVFGHAAYGLPRFIAESIQFDAALTVVEPQERYFETESYGLKLQSLWTRQRGGVDVTYGAAWYSNTHSRYKLEDWPDIVAGPKIGVVRETRFLGFLPKNGYRIAASIVPSLLHREESVIETELAATWVAFDLAAFTATGKAINTGTKAVTTRSEGRIDVPITSPSRGLRSLFYVAIRNGQDHYKDYKLSGTETVAGFRYHSTGFIGDVSFRIVGERPWKKTPIGSAP